MSNWYTSDTHWNHKNIVRGTTEWGKKPSGPVGGIHGLQSTRNFDTLEEHNKAIIDGINKYVKEDDVLWHLGDWSFGGFANIWAFRHAIKCRHIHLIYGNHDEHIERNTVYQGVPAQDLFTTTQYYAHLKHSGKELILSHYAMRVWNRSHHGAIHLYGHSHDSLEREVWGKSMDVGIDSAFRLFGEYRPFSEEDIMGIMEKREAKIVDHHNKHTT